MKNKKKSLTVEEEIYLCKYHDIDAALPTNLGISSKEINKTLVQLKKDGVYEQYRNLNEKEYETIIKLEKKLRKKESVIVEEDKSKNQLLDLNDILFDELNKLMDDNLTQDKLEKELKISKQVVSVSQTIINNANMLLQAKKYFDTTQDDNSKLVPLLSLEERNEENI